MKTTKRILSIVLTVFLFAGIFSATSFADNAETLHGEETLGQSILQFKKTRSGSGIGSGYSMNVSIDRHEIRTGSQIDYLDWGYGDKNIFLIPRSTGIVSFTLERTQAPHMGSEDVNRWWRWDSWVNNQAWVDGNAGGMYAKTRGSKPATSYAVIKSAVKETKYIGITPHSCFQWTGGGKNRVNYADIYVDSSLALGQKAVLWSANGTDVDFQLALSWAEPSEWVVAGDIGKHTIAMAERRDVVYDLNGGSLNGDTNDQRYICWTTGYADSSQLHDTISAPTREGYIFKGWKCVANDGSSAVTVGQIYQPGHANCCFAVLSNVKFQAVWEDEHFYVAHVQNGSLVGTPAVYNMADYRNQTLDLTALVPSGWLYGGIYSDDSFTAPSTSCGLNIKPEAGKTYYIREVSDAYLRPKNLVVVRTIRDDSGAALYGNYETDTYLVTAIDKEGVSKSFYKEYGTVMNGNSDNRKKGNASVGSGAIGSVYYLYDSITVDNSAYGRANSTYLPEHLFGTLGLSANNSYLGCITYALNQESSEGFRYRCYYVTADNVLVMGTVERTVSARETTSQKPTVSDAAVTAAVLPCSSLNMRRKSTLAISDTEAVLGQAETQNNKGSLSDPIQAGPVPRKPDAELHKEEPAPKAEVKMPEQTTQKTEQTTKKIEQTTQKTEKTTTKMVQMLKGGTKTKKK